MPRTYVKAEYFQYIEKKGSVTVDDLAKRFGLSKEHAASWLSKWAGKRYLTLMPRAKGTSVKVKEGGKRGRPRGPYGHYVIGPFWWGELVYDSSLRGA